ncbi:hypothetical protein [Polycladidibacter stylochi]|uniref:hypothetical protein n=1 Tax=Polycladidibacter stylochi TaxID=1807766 RepID=UPI00083724EC|nr:hypothetical protein [Pseudovibrio stylochi]
MTNSLASCLSDFTAENPPSIAEAQEIKEIVSRLPKSYSEGGDWVNRVFEAYENGVSEGLETAREESEKKIEAMKRELDQKLADERASFKANEGMQLEMELANAIREIEETVAHSVAQILVPFIEEQARVRAVSTLVSVLKSQLSSNSSDLVLVEGPEDLQGMFKAKLDSDGKIDFKINDKTDLLVKVGDMKLSTGLDEWRDELYAALKG